MIANRRRCLATAAVAVFTLTACSGGADDAVPSTIEQTTTTVRPPVVTDRRLTIGLMVPSSDSLIAEPVQDAVELAVEQINDAGGVLDTRVRLVVADEGSSSASAGIAVQTLLDSGVDAIIGPASSPNALSTLDEIVDAGTLACSPTASAMALDGFPDDDLFFRTIPSDSLQARAIAQAADQTGAQRAAIVYVDDAYGRPFAAAIDTTLQSGSINVIDSIPFTSTDDSLSDEARRVNDSDAQVVIVLAGSDDGTRFLEALNEEGADELATIIVNDALRNPSTPQRIAGLDDDFRTKIVGLAPQAESADPEMPFDPPGPFASNAFDCVNLIALSAVRADSDDPMVMADQMAFVSASGSSCSSFARCVETFRDGFQIDYNGPSGLTELSARTGDTARATFDRFFFNQSGEDELQRTVVVAAG
ncbi:MAG: ABC transporter substrate-binding protein [Ilumatobacteraceae bacterium]